MDKLIDIVVGARPNFIKVAAIIRELRTKFPEPGNGIRYRLIHTSQHYDNKMSGVFFEELDIPQPDINLNVGHLKSTEQIATIISRYSRVLIESKPDMVIVLGDVNSTVACALATKKTYPDLPLIHVEAGLRCGDRQMPEEINRILTDSISDYFFTTSRRASDNLMNEGVSPGKIFFVGNTMIDTLYTNESRLKQPTFWNTLGLANKGYYVLTLHRQANISSGEILGTLLESVAMAAEGTTVVFPVHPHTEKMIHNFGIEVHPNIVMTDPMGYLEFNYLMKNALAVVTDSGGISEETTIMKVPCITLRDHTERPETCQSGTNLLVGSCNPGNIFDAFDCLRAGKWRMGKDPELWDGKAAERIVDFVAGILRSGQEDKHTIYTLRPKAFGDISYNTIFLN
ncbi:MAG: UDP-N-acetylglucosamine 2-epimerase (non-hydrolyzing) [Chitinophagaceae bacterium]